MFFIGLITNQKNEIYIKNELEKIIPPENLIFINEKNINNMKNIIFETVLIDEKINNIIELRKIVSKSKYVILNSDFEINKKIFENLNLNVITYGFNNKGTFTVSSIEENEIIICLQRIIFTKNGRKIEPQEYEMKNDENIDKYTIMASKILSILYSKNK